ncbi:hypothetical protein F2Q68_00007666 [Brassica cretica]|uniref:Uncharacterized protein n=1 Tax=Brassica cretica TaxID=69181 RepID=A0A8S9L3M5_BRACR|nr:hypothetical protein F2Q68_00007666 [Brassica cretica]
MSESVVSTVESKLMSSNHWIRSGSGGPSDPGRGKDPAVLGSRLASDRWTLLNEGIIQITTARTNGPKPKGAKSQRVKGW